MKATSLINRILRYLLLCILVISAGCNTDEPGTHPEHESLEGIFESFWHQMNENYVFWDVDSTDWNGVYDQYQSLFSQLDLNKEADVGTAAMYFQEITKNIRDGHYFIDFAHPTIANSDVYPIQTRKEAMGLLNSALKWGTLRCLVRTL